jgi:hypothetical protein
MKILLPHEAASKVDVPGRRGDLRLDEPDPVGTQVVEQPDTVTEEQRREVDHHLVEQTGSEVLLRYVRAFHATPTVSLRPQGIGRSLICQARVHDVAERLVGMLRPASALDGARHAEERRVEAPADTRPSPASTRRRRIPAWQPIRRPRDGTGNTVC